MTRAERTVRRRRRPAVWYWLIPVTVALLAGLAVLAVSFAYASRVSRLTTIYPNISVNGVDVGGMTMQEAARVLGDDPARYDDASVTVNFSTGDSLTVTAQQLGMSARDGTAFAQRAFAYGRGGSLLANLQSYRACQKQPVQLQYPVEETRPDETALEALVAPVAEKVEQTLSVAKAEIRENDITVVKSMGMVQVDEQAICERIRQAFLTEQYGTFEYEVTPPDKAQQDQTVTDVLQTLYDAVYKAPVDAYYDAALGQVVEGEQGVRFDMDEARRLWDEAEVGQTVTIPFIREDPAVTADMVAGEFFEDVLAEKSTSLSGSSSARINNITLAANAMNGVVLQPGEQFDYNACLGQRTAAKGYQEAGVYSNGKHETAIGGGICQGSSTLYYCALYANLRITERHNHMFVVGYLPRGLDATVSWGWPEFKFVNSRDYPIKIEAYVSGGYLTVRILGTDVDGSYVVMTSDTWEDSDYYYAQTYRNVYDANGNLISSAKEAYSDYYKHEQTAATPAPTQPPAQQQAQAPAAAPEASEQTQTQEPALEAPPPAEP